MVPDLTTILYAEDEQDIREVALLALEAVGGFTVKVCENGQEVIDTVEDYSPDLILLDVMMPVMDGPTALKTLRDKNMINEIPVIFMTAKIMETEIDRYIDLGAAGVIAKPFDPMTLADQIRDIWSKAHA